MQAEISQPRAMKKQKNPSTSSNIEKFYNVSDYGGSSRGQETDRIQIPLGIQNKNQ